MAQGLDFQSVAQRAAAEQKEAYEKQVAEANEALKMLDALENNVGWQWLKKMLADKAETARSTAMRRDHSDQMARDIGYMSALMDIVRFPVEQAKVLRTQLANSKL